MRRKIPYRVCNCTPDGVITHLEARLLKDIVNQAIHPIRCAASCKWKYMRGMRIGDLCAETGHFLWALKVWSLTASLIESKDYDDWRYVWFDNYRVRLRDVISETECELLERRCSQLWRALGFPKYDWWNERVEYLASRYFGTCYYYLYEDKFDGYYDELIGEWEEEMMQFKAKQETEQLFREAQGDNLHPSSQDFFDYWHDGPHIEDFSWLTFNKEWL
jgi:hypothetical protein